MLFAAGDIQRSEEQEFLQLGSIDPILGPLLI